MLPAKRWLSLPFTRGIRHAARHGIEEAAAQDAEGVALLRHLGSRAMRAAAPSATQSGAGRVPERTPRSCPPPSNSGSSRTRGRRRT